MSEMEEQVNKTSLNNLPTAKQVSTDKTELAINILETVPKSMSQQGIDLDTNLQDDQLQDEDEQDRVGVGKPKWPPVFFIF